jgi:chromosome segregation ATPase
MIAVSFSVRLLDYVGAVPRAGIEPAPPKGPDFESGVSASSTTWARVSGTRYQSFSMLNGMSRSLVERRLTELAEQAKVLRRELAVADEQLGHLDEDAEEARLRALVAETPLAGREHRDAQRHADAMRRHRQEITDELARIDRAQDELHARLLER